MDQEISKGTWIGAGLLAIVAILGLAFAVYGIARSLVNSSSADFVNTVESVGSSTFNDYDGTVVSGLQVRSALADFEGDKIAVLINTAGIQQAIAGSTTADATTVDFTKLIRQEDVDTNYNVGAVFNGKAYIMYNALFDITAQTTFTDSKEGYLVFNGAFKLRGASSDLMFNTIKANYKTTGCTEYIANGTNFNAKLVRDASGTVIGIMFSQVY